MIVGFARTGSHALVDLLSEYDNIGVYPGEFNMFRTPGLISDMLEDKEKCLWPNLIEHYTTYNSLVRRVVDKLIPDGLTNNNFVIKNAKYFPNLEKKMTTISYIRSISRLNDVLNSNTSLDNKIQATNSWINKLGYFYAKEKEYLILDQPIKPSSNLSVWTEVFKPFKVIFSIRNPRDQIADLLKAGYLYKPYGTEPTPTWGGGILESIYGRNKQGAIKMFIDSMIGHYQQLEVITRSLGPDSLLLVKFENLVNNYQNTKSEIERFIGNIEGHHIQKRKYFDPEKSKKNINFYNEFLTNDDVEIISVLEDWINQNSLLSKYFIMK